MRRNRLFALLSALPLLLVCSKTCPWRKLLSEYRHRRFFAGESGCAAAAAAAAAAEGRDGQAQFAFPRLIHQTWKTKNESLQPSWVRRSVASWKAANPGFVHRVWDDGEMEAHVTAHHPEYLASYSKLRIVEKADFFRYMVLHDIGGVYADVDTSCNCAVTSWGARGAGAVAHNRSGLRDVGVIVGMEAANLRTDGFPQLIQWAIAARRGHRVTGAAMQLIDSNVKSGRFASGSQQDVIAKTGPVAWTRAVHPYLQALGIRGGDLTGSRNHRVADVFVLRAGALKFELVGHEFAGSWKNVSGSNVASDGEFMCHSWHLPCASLGALYVVCVALLRRLQERKEPTKLDVD